MVGVKEQVSALSSSLTVDQHKELFVKMNTEPLIAIKDLSTTLNRKVTAMDLASLSIAPSTMENRIRIEQDYLKVVMPMEMELWSVDSIMAYITIVINRPTWKKASGLLNVLYTLWTLSALHGVPQLSQDIRMKNLAQGIRRVMKAQEVSQAVPITLEQVNQLVEHCLKVLKNIMMAAIFGMLWLLAMRVGDLLRITTNAVDITRSPISVTLRWHKTQMSNMGEMSIIKDSMFSKIIVEWVEMRKNQLNNYLLFPTSFPQIVQVMNSVLGPMFSRHSFRRGALQHLAQQGLMDQEILELSGHSSKAALQIYLNAPTPARMQSLNRAQQALSYEK
jgi:integrase